MEGNSPENFRLTYNEIKKVLVRILSRYCFSDERADLCATLFTETTLDGVYSHGLNRFPLFIDYIKKGLVKPGNKPVMVNSFNHTEQWDGNSGPGNLNAWFCMDRAIQLADQYGSGVVTLRNTNHWMRGGTYGIQAAERNCIGICMTNTIPNMPPWGGRENRIGNNPIIISAPRDPYPLLLDMAMSQYSYGKMEIMSQKGKKLAYPGGYNKNLESTTDPDEIIESELAMPAGYWKGSGLAIMIDTMVSLLSGGLTSSDIGKFDNEHSLSQLFMAFNLDHFGNAAERNRIINSVIESVTQSKPADPGTSVTFPGQQTWIRRNENLKLGIPVNKSTWKELIKYTIS